MAETVKKAVDAVIVGFGWTGAILAKELTEAGLNVVALERGAMRDTATDAIYPRIIDELTYGVRGKLYQDLSRETVTLRHDASQNAVPYRQLGAFLPGEGVGGAGFHWNGLLWRAQEDELQMRSRYEARYGAGIIPDDIAIQDTGVSYQDLEPHFDFFEKVAGASGQAGNINGRIVSGGNPFEAPRSGEFPLPALRPTYAQSLFAKATANLGYHPFPTPAANASDAYTNPYGAQMGPCNFCGFCVGYGCYLYSKASPNVNILPVLRQAPGFELRTNAHVVKVERDSTGKKATGVSYYDAEGRLVRQPADIVILAAFQYNNVRLMLLSGIGAVYDPKSGEGLVGKNFAYQTQAPLRLFFDKTHPVNGFIGAGASGMAIDDFFGPLDHRKMGFLGGGPMWLVQPGSPPITGTAVPPGTPQWGSAWKKAAKDYYAHNSAIVLHGTSMPNRANFLDLDPTYRDSYGLPLLRMTYDYRGNDFAMVNALAPKLTEIGRAMGATALQPLFPTPGKGFNFTAYNSTHLFGGTIMGETPGNSVVNRYLQSWDVPNLFIMGGSVMPQGLGYNPTGVVAALAYWSAKAIRGQYLKAPGPLVPA